MNHHHHHYQCSVCRQEAVTGADYEGPLYLKDSNKVWICLFTCCVIRAVHHEAVSDMTAETVIRCFKQFIARRSIPHKIISDNGKMFKLANKIISIVLSQPQTILLECSC